MRSVHVVLALGLAALGLHGCLTDFEHLCQTDDDCPGNQRCLIADGDATGTFSHGNVIPLTVELELAEAFDWVGDGIGDANDCDPDDPTVHPGAPDPCDGKVQACGQSACTIDLEGLSVLDIACSPGARKCAAVVAQPAATSGKVRIWDETATTHVEVEGVTKAKGIAWNTASDQHHLIMVEPNLVSFSNPAGERLLGYLVTTLDLAGSLHLSVHGNVGIAAGADPFTILAFDPRVLIAKTEGVSCSFESSCSQLGVDSVFNGPTGLPSGSRITGAVTHRPGGVGNVVSYLSFANDSRIGYLQLNSSWQVRGESSGIFAPFSEDSEIRFIAPFSGESRFFVSLRGPEDKHSATWVQMQTGYDLHTPPVEIDLPPDSCPAALDTNRSASSLLIADDCNGVLWELPLDGDGKPTEGEPIRHDLAGCNKPFVIDSLPATDEQGPMTFVGCEGKSHILVLGRN